MKQYLENTTITEDKKNDENTYYTYIQLKKGLSDGKFHCVIDNLDYSFNYGRILGLLEVTITLPKKLDEFRPLNCSSNLLCTSLTLCIKVEENLSKEKLNNMVMHNNYTYDVDTGILIITHTIQ